jgi:transcriptional regulator with XRE-family HTH domain
MQAGERLRSFRVARGSSQEALAAEITALGCKCTQSFVGLVEHGKRRVGLEFAHAVEALTKDWDEGPIRTEEWLQEDDAPTVKRHRGSREVRS